MCLNDDVQKQDYVILIGQNKIAKIIHYVKNRIHVSNILMLVNTNGINKKSTYLQMLHGWLENLRVSEIKRIE